PTAPGGADNAAGPAVPPALTTKGAKIAMMKPKTFVRSPTLRFTPYSWAKLLYLRDRGETEVGGLGISCPESLLLVEEVELVRQLCSVVTVAFDDESVADFYDRQTDAGRQPQEFSRIWIHTHPGACARPSQTDEQTFRRVFGGSDWAVMFILAQDWANIRTVKI
ncbi:MAG: Mov34/MPN/PAD-1 family protein, partial [Planctomycetaceae bacterium]|nr:Mov34/MPN/PAD-1 family protein [Planctomycetaceae bacterium]